MDTIKFEAIELRGRNDEVIRFSGARLGSGTSRRETHDHDLYERTQAGRFRCGACRWYEVDIYVKPDHSYVVHTVGESTVPGEIRFSRIIETPSAYEVVELLTVRKRDADPYLPVQAARALAQAAALEDDIHDAYVNRAVV